jgi:hypothetical protein
MESFDLRATKDTRDMEDWRSPPEGCNNEMTACKIADRQNDHRNGSTNVANPSI